MPKDVNNIKVPAINWWKQRIQCVLYQFAITFAYIYIHNNDGNNKYIKRTISDKKCYNFRTRTLQKVTSRMCLISRNASASPHYTIKNGVISSGSNTIKLVEPYMKQYSAFGHENSNWHIDLYYCSKSTVDEFLSICVKEHIHVHVYTQHQWKVTSKSQTLNTERRTALNFMA